MATDEDVPPPKLQDAKEYAGTEGIAGSVFLWLGYVDTALEVSP